MCMTYLAGRLYPNDKKSFIPSTSTDFMNSVNRLHTFGDFGVLSNFQPHGDLHKFSER